jgi:hypothetical protein
MPPCSVLLSHCFQPCYLIVPGARSLASKRRRIFDIARGHQSAVASIARRAIVFSLLFTMAGLALGLDTFEKVL